MTDVERLLEVNGARLWLATEGTGPPMLFLSGGPGCCDYLAPVSSLVADLMTTYRLEPRGCGRSSPEGPFALDTMVADLESVRASLGHEQWVVAGHSWGSLAALAYALSHPDRTSALVCLAGAGLQNDRDWHAAYDAGLAAGRERELEFAYPFNPAVNREGNQSAKEFLKAPSLFRSVADLRVPALLVQGEADIRPNWPVAQLAELLPAASYHVVPGADHFLWLTQPEALARLLRDFLQLRTPRT
ncbi:alpha/beta fold hydrolase [Flindersiella endophytica]